jgi:hypothetical protein
MYQIIKFISRTEVFFFALLWLIFLLISGTVAQKYLGLYLAQDKYFSSYIILLYDVIPVPGGYSIMILIALSLFLKLWRDKWRWSNLGVVMIHLGVLLLLLGSFVTMQTSQEGNMIIEEGETIDYISDYHKLELVIRDISVQNYLAKINFQENELKKGNIIDLKSLNTTLKIKEFCRNCKILYNESGKDLSKLTIYDMSKLFALKKTSPAKVEEENNSGIIIELTHDNVTEEYSIFELMPVAQYLKIGKKYYHVKLRHLQTKLPFALQLSKFHKTTYMASHKAKSYQSDIIVKDGKIAWNSVIRMNQPLRYKGYSFYQSSFVETENNKATILAVVQNNGRLYPYIATIIICLGLLLHLLQRGRFNSYP